MEASNRLATCATIISLASASIGISKAEDPDLQSQNGPDPIVRTSQCIEGLQAAKWQQNTLQVNPDNFATYPATAQVDGNLSSPFEVAALSLETPQTPSAATGFGGVFQITDSTGAPVGINGIDEHTTVSTLLVSDEALFDAFFLGELNGDIHQSTLPISSEEVFVKSIDDELGLVEVLVANEGIRLPSQSFAQLTLVLDNLVDGAEARVLTSSTDGPEGVIISDEELFIQTFEYQEQEEGQTVTPAFDIFYGEITPILNLDREAKEMVVTLPSFSSGLILDSSSSLQDWDIPSDPPDQVVPEAVSSPARFSMADHRRLFFRFKETIE